MSQRLLICDNEPIDKRQIFDAIITPRTKDIATILWDDFFQYDFMSGGFVGPWRIYIESLSISEKVDPILNEIFTKLGKVYPNDVWEFSYGESGIEHPTTEELKQFLKGV